jgi:hypothetical protein
MSAEPVDDDSEQKDIDASGVDAHHDRAELHAGILDSQAKKITLPSRARRAKELEEPLALRHLPSSRHRVQTTTRQIARLRIRLLAPRRDRHRLVLEDVRKPGKRGLTHGAVGGRERDRSAPT